MSFRSASLSTTIRQQSPWLMSPTAGFMLFVLVAAAAFGWKYHQSPSPKPTPSPRATARVCVHRPDFAYQPIWGEILAQSKSEIRDHLKLVADHFGGMTVVSISLNDLPRETIVPLVNMVATAYAQSCRSQWKLDVEQACTLAQEKVRELQRSAEKADSRLDSLLRRQSEPGTKAEPSAPALVDNPQWTEAARRLAEFEEKRRVLLFERTPLHPSVQEIEIRISDVRRELATIPAKVDQASLAAPPSAQRPPALPPVKPDELDAAQQVAMSLHGQLQQAQTAARTALTARNEELRVDIEPAEVLPPVVAPQRFGPALLGTVLLTAAISVIGLGMISYGASLERSLSSIGDLQALLPVPVLGVVPAVHSGRSARSTVRRLVRYAAILSGSLLLIAVGWFFFHAT